MIKYIIFDLLGVLYPDETGVAKKAVDALKKRGYKIASITNLEATKARQVAAGLGIENLYACSELNLSKRKPEIYRKFLSDQKVNSKECVMIDDHEYNLIWPKKLGMKSVLFGKDNPKNVDFVINNLEQLQTLL